MRELLTLLLLVVYLITNADNWTQKSNLGAGTRFDQASFSIGNKGYFIAGDNNGGFYQDAWEYDPTSDLWTQIASLPYGVRSDAVGFSIGTKGFVGMGYGEGFLFYSDFWEYDPLINTWTQKANYPGAGGVGLSGCIGFSIGNKGYIGTGGGWSTGSLKCSNEFWEYDTLADTWTQKANFDGGARWFAVGFSIGNKGYVGTGDSASQSGDFFKNDFWEYDQATDSWSRKADFNGTSRGYAVCFSIGNKGYIGNGGRGSGAGFCYYDFSEFDASTNIWTSKASYPGGGGAGVYDAAGFSIGGRGYIGGGGAPIYSRAQQDFWEYIPDSVTGINEFDESKVNIYPNPFSKITTICTNRVLKHAACNVYDLNGRKIKSIIGINGNEFQLSRENIKEGIYTFQLIENERVITGQFIIE